MGDITIRSLGGNTSVSDNPETNKSKVYQDNAADLKCEPTQTDASKLEVTINQATASEAQVEPVQTNPDELLANVYSVGGDIRADYSSTAVEVSLSTSAARSTQLAVGLYEITSDYACMFLQGDSSVTALTSSHKLWAQTYKLIYVSNTTTKGYISGIMSAGTGTLTISKIG